MAAPPREVELGRAGITSLPRRDYTGSRDFSAVWAQVFSGAVRVLVARGVAAAVAEDAVQEAGTRALARTVPFGDADDLARWVTTVAWRIAVDEHRRHGRRSSSTEDAPEPVAADDVAYLVESRIDLRRVLTAWPQLSDADRAALVEATPAGGDRRRAVRHAVRRHRARARLVALMEAVGAVVVALVARARRTTSVVALAALPVAGAFLVYVGDRDGRHEDRRPPTARDDPSSLADDGWSRPQPAAGHAGSTGAARRTDRPRDGKRPAVDVGPTSPRTDLVVADVRSRPKDDRTVACVRAPVGETCVAGAGEELKLSHLDDPLEPLVPLPSPGG